MSWITASKSLHVELHYHVLSHLDLDADAASLFTRRKNRAPGWVAPLADAYARAPGRLFAQMLPLYCRNLDGLRQLLGAITFPGLDDEAGRALCARLAAAIEAERADVESRWQCDDTDEMRAYLAEHLAPLRAALYLRTGKPEPGLHIEACDALTTGDFSHARATSAGGRRAIAVSFRPPREHVLCQVLHEEIHPVTDPPIRKRHAASQDTRAGTAGYVLHRELERAAVEAGQELLQRHAPRLLAPYARWRARYNC